MAGKQQFDAVVTKNLKVLSGNVEGVVPAAATNALTRAGLGITSGTATLVAGAVVVANTTITASSVIQLTVQSLGTVADPKAVAVTARSNGVSFTIRSADATDTSVVGWVIIN